MSNTVEYNKEVVRNVQQKLSNLLTAEETKLSIESSNKGKTYDKIIECANAYNQIETNVRSMIMQVNQMLDNVMTKVNELENSGN